MAKLTEILAIRLKELREAKKLTQSEVGDGIGQRRESVARMESGNWEPRLKTVAALSRFFGVEETYFFDVGGSVERIEIEHPIEVCLQRVTKAVKEAKAAEGQREKPELPGRPLPRQREMLLEAFELVKAEIASLPRVQQDNFLEDLKKRIAGNKR